MPKRKLTVSCLYDHRNRRQPYIRLRGQAQFFSLYR
jgi:hypothetical protein